LNAVSIYPNPVKSIAQLNINSKSAGKISIMITDILGRTLQQQELNAARGNQLITLNTSNLSTGNYYITVRWNEEQITEKMVKL
jgi:Secretion system C-terminal sorting domain